MYYLPVIKKQVPLLLANARLSEKSHRGYLKLAPLTKDMLACFSYIAAQSQADGDRFIALGASKKCVQVTGNIKFDVKLPEDLLHRGLTLRQQWGATRPVWIAASTHDTEEVLVLEAFKKILTQIPQALLILVPRHPQRFKKVEQLCEQAGYKIALRSQADPVNDDTQILVGDTMGELLLFYAASDVALVCGSFAPIGGHNLIEPAILGVPSLTGPQLHNFKEISRLLLNVKGAQLVHNADEIAQAVQYLLRENVKRIEMGERAREAVLANTGALAKHLQWIEGNISLSLLQGEGRGEGCMG